MTPHVVPSTSSQLALAALTLAVGLALLGYMITAEGEPGAIPLLLTAIGAGWSIGLWRRAGHRRDAPDD